MKHSAHPESSVRVHIGPESVTVNDATGKARITVPLSEAYVVVEALKEEKETGAALLVFAAMRKYQRAHGGQPKVA